MELKEITIGQLNPAGFIQDKVQEIMDAVGGGFAVNALSGGVDSSVVTMLGHRALGSKLKTYFIENGIMREGEARSIVEAFAAIGVKVEVIDAKKQFFSALKGLEDPEEKREAITQTFYKTVFGPLVKKSKAKFLLQGTNFTDVEETVAGVKRQHNILSQLGIDTKKAFGYTVLEPIIQLRKTGVRRVGRVLGLPRAIYDRPPFPGPALSARVIGEVTPKRIETVRSATRLVEEALRQSRAFQYLAILHQDMVTGVRNGKRDFGMQIEIRCWNSRDAVTATPTRLPWGVLERLAAKITSEVEGVVSVTYNVTSKPPSTMEAV